MKWKKENELAWGLLLLFVLLIYAVFSITQAMSKSNIEGKFSVKGIKLVDVRPADCWNEDLNPQFCPIPTDIEVEGKVENLYGLMVDLAKTQNQRVSEWTAIPTTQPNSRPLFEGR